MRTINNFITESKSMSPVQLNLAGGMFLNLFHGSNLKKDVITKMLSNLDIKTIEELEKYINKIDSANAFPYMATNDEFLIASNKDNIIEKLADYIEKFVAI